MFYKLHSAEKYFSQIAWDRTLTSFYNPFRCLLISKDGEMEMSHDVYNIGKSSRSSQF